MGLGLGLRSKSLDTAERLQAGIDARRVRSRVTPFPTAGDLEAAAAELRSNYTDYVTNVSSPGMAASLETASLLLALVKVRKAERALDLGSGFSSFVLRSALPESGAVVSVDDNHDWLEATRDYLDRHGVKSDYVQAWREFQPTATYDLVFHDLAGGEIRNAAAATAAACVSPGGVIVFDDAHHAPHRQAAKEACAQHGLRPYSLRSITLDDIGRWAVIGAPDGHAARQAGQRATA